ncbi:hypothetical protein DFH08DRAFT_851868 [Mycena albidolilacea]|uniref:DUF6534 domain-containing protein n=1 Tax=Mycena albidolilacea TaxID=1033008 RepID=A0AAD7ADB4_9AGAR|nr:hypothetical protein DFH08DRAFT_851868 [Mycena albidolilacea]
MAAAFHYPPGYLDALARPLMIGFMISAPLYGIAIAQAAYYFRAFPKDPIYVKTVVAILIVIDTVHMIIMIQSYNSWFLVDLLAPVFPKPLTMNTLLAYLVMFLTQGIYAMRIWILSNNNRPVTALVIILAVAQLVGGLVQAIDVTINNTFDVVQGSKTFRVCFYLLAPSSLACDTLITASMVYFLKGHSSAVQRTSQIMQIVNKIVTYTLSVGMLTTACTAGTFIAWRVSINTFDFLILHFVLSKLCLNSLLVMLNSRLKLRETLYDATAIELNSANDRY